MTDCFEALGLPRRLDVDEETIDRQFKEATRSAHPDAGGVPETFQALNSARHTLTDPCSRLSHWIELETGKSDPPDGRIPPLVMDLFQQVGSALQESESILKSQAAKSSHLAKALLAKKANQIQGHLLALNGKLRAAQDRLREQLPEIQKRHQTEPVEALEQARAIKLEWQFLKKWGAEVQAQLGRFLG